MNHEGAGETYPPGENWTPVGTWPNGKTLAHLLGCEDCRSGHRQALAQLGGSSAK